MNDSRAPSSQGNGLPGDALPLPEAVRRFVPNDLWETYATAIRRRASFPQRIVTYSTWIEGEAAAAKNRPAVLALEAQAAKDKAWATIQRVFLARLTEGALIAYVRREFPFGKWDPLPPDSWRALLITDWRRGTAEGGGLRLADLHIAPGGPSYSEESASRLISAEETPALAAAAVPYAERQLQLTIDNRTSKIIIIGVGELTGADYRLVAVLAEIAKQDVVQHLPPEEHRFVNVQQLTKQLKMTDGSLYRRVSKCRKAIADMAAAAFGEPVSKELVIENSPWHGFRLNPNIRIIASTGD
ncbi:hypothetical protein NKI15_18695 [Mesorhizobium sp. M0862]|uniref:hypothetical protein n=1 Tax=Mesorhizobium sp. M0862 TaxID=2957015 RepID=UPI003339D131